MNEKDNSMKNLNVHLCPHEYSSSHWSRHGGQAPKWHLCGCIKHDINFAKFKHGESATKSRTILIIVLPFDLAHAYTMGLWGIIYGI